MRRDAANRHLPGQRALFLLVAVATSGGTAFAGPALAAAPQMSAVESRAGVAEPPLCVAEPPQHDAVTMVPGEEGVEGVPQADEEQPVIRWDPYGYIKADVSVDSAAIEPGNFARWVADPELEQEHTHFNATARQTRLGLWILGPEEESLQARGRVEIDFYGGGGENKNGVQLRHAYIQVDWPGRGLRLIGGQTADIISPLVPRTVNYSVAWWSGNIGYRRPLISLTKRFQLDGGARSVSLTAGASRTIGDDFKPDEPGDAGSDSGLPSVQWRAAYTWDLAGRAATLGVSGHWGQEDLGTRIGLEDPELDSWSLNLDLSIPLGDTVTLQAEAFTGKNLDDYFGGIGQGVNVELAREVEASGGWAAVDVDPGGQARFSLGVGIDDPRDAQLQPGWRALNRSVWGNVFYDFTDYLSTAVELSWWGTDYLAQEDGSALRFQSALIFAF